MFSSVVRVFVLMGLLTSCATPDVDNVPAPLAEQVMRFSELNPDGKLPKAWQAWIITPQKNKTSYTLTKHHGKTVLHADADAAAFAEYKEAESTAALADREPDVTALAAYV